MKYQELFEESFCSVTTEVVMVTPEVAAGVLANNNTGNRQKNITRKKVADCILRGAFAFTGEPAIFSKSGRLLDGQNRLQAIVNTGVPVPMLVVRGVGEDAFEFMNRGISRNNGDRLHCLGVQNPQLVKSILGVIHSHEIGQLGSPNNRYRELQPDKVAEFFDRHRGAEDSAAFVQSGQKRRGRISPMYLGFLHYAFNQRDPGLAKVFFDQLVHNLGVQPGTHLDVLIRRLDRFVDDKRKTIVEHLEVMALAIKTWNAMRTNSPVATTLRYSPNLEHNFPEIL